MTFEAALRTMLVVVFGAGVFVGATVAALVRWVRHRQEPVRIVTITMDQSGGFTWEATYDMQARPFAFGATDTWEQARLLGIHAVIPDVDVTASRQPNPPGEP